MNRQFVNGQCWWCDVTIRPTDFDAGTYREHFCSQDCSDKEERLTAIEKWSEKTIDFLGIKADS